MSFPYLLFRKKLHECSYLVKVSMKIEMCDYIIFHKSGLEQYENFDHSTTHFSVRVIFFNKAFLIRSFIAMTLHLPCNYWGMKILNLSGLPISSRWSFTGMFSNKYV